MKEKISILGILANITLAIVKIIVGWVFNSTSVLAGGIDSFGDIFASTISYLGIKFSDKPADKGHPYGHYKFEVLASIIITLFIFSAGVGIIYDAYKTFLSPQKVELNYLVFGVMFFSVLINFLMSKLKIYYGKKENSISLLSDGIHSKIDIYTSLVILVGLFFVKYWVYADAVIATIMGIYIIKEAFSIGGNAVNSLMDVSAGDEVEGKIKNIVKAQKIVLNSLKTQKKGAVITANLEIELSSDLTVAQASEISAKLRFLLMDKIENLKYVAIQIASHKVQTSFYKPVFGKGFGWQKKGKFKGKIPQAQGKGIDGLCVCEQCGYKMSHKQGIPCAKIKCPKCGTYLQRR